MGVELQKIRTTAWLQAGFVLAVILTAIAIVCTGYGNPENCDALKKKIQKAQAEQSQHYSERFAKLHDNAAGAQILYDEQDYAARNAVKTENDFGAVENVKLEHTESTLAAVLVQPGWKEGIAVVWAIFLCYFLLLREKELGIFALFATTPVGCKKLAKKRLLAVLTLVFLFYIVVCFLHAIWSGSLYGVSGLFSPVQGVSGMDDCAAPVSAIVYVLLLFLERMLAIGMIAAVVYDIAMWLKSPAMASLCLLAIAGIESVFYFSIRDTSVLSPLRYINMIAMLDGNAVIGHYRNICILGWPVTLWMVGLAVMLLIGIAAGVHSAFGYRHALQQSVADTRGRQSRRSRGARWHSLWFWENDKLWRLQGIWLPALLFILFSIFSFQPEDTYYKDADEYYYQEYMEQLAGTVTDRVGDYIERETERYETVRSRMAAVTQEDSGVLYGLSRQLAGQNAFDRVTRQYENCLNRKGTQMVYDTGYQWILGEEGDAKTVFLFLELVLLTAVLLSGLFVTEKRNGAQALIQTTPTGERGVNAVKRGIAVLVYSVLYGGIFGGRLLAIGIEYGFPSLHAPAASLVFLADLSSGISILTWILLCHVFYYFCGILVLFVMLEWSKRMQSHGMAVVISMAVGVAAAGFLQILFFLL